MVEETTSVLRGDHGDPPANGLNQSFPSSSFGLAHQSFDLGKSLLYGIEVRRIGWQVEQLAALRSSISSLTLSPLWALRGCPSLLPDRDAGWALIPFGRKVRRPPGWLLLPQPEKSPSPQESYSRKQRCVRPLRLRGTEQDALSPLGAQAYKGESEVFVPISSTNTSRRASSS